MATNRITPEQWFGRSAEEQLRYLQMQDHERHRQNRMEYETWLKKPPSSRTQSQAYIFAQEFCSAIEPTQPEPKRHGMNYSTAIFLINNNVRAVKGTYQQDGTTAVFKTFDTTIQKDDLVVVPTGTRHGMTVFKITEVEVDVDMDAGMAMDWVVGKVDIDSYKQIALEEADAIAKIKSAELRKKRTDLAEALFKDNIDTLKALPIATKGGEVPAA